MTLNSAIVHNQFQNFGTKGLIVVFGSLDGSKPHAFRK